jgi:hypothetical protein
MRLLESHCHAVRRLAQPDRHPRATTCRTLASLLHRLGACVVDGGSTYVVEWWWWRWWGGVVGSCWFVPQTRRHGLCLGVDPVLGVDQENPGTDRASIDRVDPKSRSFVMTIDQHRRSRINSFIQRPSLRTVPMGCVSLRNDPSHPTRDSPARGCAGARGVAYRVLMALLDGDLCSMARPWEPPSPCPPRTGGGAASRWLVGVSVLVRNCLSRYRVLGAG